MARGTVASPPPGRRLLMTAIGLGVVAAAALAAAPSLDSDAVLLRICEVVALCALAAYVVLAVHPAYLLLGGVLLAPFAGQWDELAGVPGAFSPQRVLLVGAVIGALVRLAAGRWPPLRGHAVYVLLALATAYALGSAAAAGTLTEKDEFFRLFDAYGLLPFAIFAIAPTAFGTPERRQLLLAVGVGMGLYLGLTALLETVGPKALVFPGYINDPTVGIHFGRARGPFVEAVTNGSALFACGVMAAVAVALWRSGPARALACATALLCSAGLLLTLQRSVWFGAAVSLVIVMIAFAEVRRRALPILVLAALAVGAAVAVVPSSKLRERANDSETVWARKNLNRAAWNVVQAHPLVGAGWGMFVPLTEHGDYFVQADDYPLVGVGNDVHNQLLANAAELGLVGATVWLLALALAVWGVVTAPIREPDLRLWRVAFVAYAVFYFVTSSFVPAHLFPNLLFWLLAGVVWSAWQAEPVARATPRWR